MAGERRLTTPKPAARFPRPGLAGGSLFASAAVAGAILLVAFLARTSRPERISAGAGAIGPFDDLYHAHRLLFSAAHPGKVLGFDPLRGVAGAFCPWPPLYDAAGGAICGALARATGTRTLDWAIWMPPVTTALFLAAVTFLLTRRGGIFSGSLFGIAAALAPASIDVSRLGAIDHHFLEPPLALGIAGSVVLLLRSRSAASRRWAGLALAGAIVLALSIQVALLFAAGIALLCVLAFAEEPLQSRAAAIGFALAAGAVFLFRALQSPGYPDDEWFLGTGHGAALLGAAAASLLFSLLRARGMRRVPAAAAAVGGGILAAAAIPGAPATLLSGSRFFGGDPWLATIDEFQPIFSPERVGGFGRAALDVVGGGVLVAVFALSVRRRPDAARRVLALFAVAYLAATLTSVRFLVLAVTLIALAGAVAARDLFRSRGPVAGALAAAALLVPWGLAAIPRILSPVPAVPPEAAPFLRAAVALRSRGGAEAALTPWPWGHVFEVLGGKRVLVDGFGSSIGATEFDNAIGVLLSPREDVVADYCRRTGTRWIVLDNPVGELPSEAEAIGVPADRFVVNGPPARITRACRFSFWWRAYFDRGRAIDEGGHVSPAFRRFRLLSVDSALSGPPPFQGPAVEIWERIDSRD